MPPKKRKRSCPFSSAKTGPKKSKKSLDKEWASKLVESDKGLFYPGFYKQEKWLEDYASDQKSKDAPVSASCSTIYLNYIVLHEKRIIYCKQNDNNTFAYCSAGNNSWRKFVPVTCYLSKSYC